MGKCPVVPARLLCSFERVTLGTARVEPCRTQVTMGEPQEAPRNEGMVESIVKVGKSRIPDAGEGLFTTRVVEKGRKLYTEKLVWAVNGGWMREDAQSTFVAFQNCSGIWSLVYKLACEGEPPWWSQLATQRDYVHQTMQREKNGLAIVFSELRKAVLIPKLIELFGQVLTNNMIVGAELDDGTPVEVVACGERYSKMNHARGGNARTVVSIEGEGESILHGTATFTLDCYATVEMPEEAEITIDYGQSAGERGLK